jgi:1-acyl-sn-glycerol-3-phosphate acyltransferase
MGLVGDRSLIPKEGPLLLAINHQSFLDPWMLSWCFPRPIQYLMTAKWYYKSPAWTYFFKKQGCEPVREGNSRGTIDAVCNILARDGVSGVFPEGGISHDGKIKRFRPGLARMAARSGALTIPVGIRGSFKALPRSKFFPRPHPVKFHVGAPIEFPGAPYDGPPPRDISNAFTREVFEAVCRLAGQEERIALLDEGPEPATVKSAQQA